MKPDLLEDMDQQRRLRSSSSYGSWAEANQLSLIREFARLRARLGVEEERPSGETVQQSGEPLDPPAAIDALAETFRLSPFERDLLLLCAGVEMDSAMAARCAEMVGRSQRSAITFALALATLADPHWSALSPSAPLRRYRLIEIEGGQGLTGAAVRIEERILHYLAGINQLDARLESFLQSRPQPVWIAEEHRALGEQIDGDWDCLLHLLGDDPRGQEDIAALLAQRSGRKLYILRAENLPNAGGEVDQFIQLWGREALLLPAVLLLQMGSATVTNATQQLVERLPGPLIMGSREPIGLHRHAAIYEVNKPEPASQMRLWRKALGRAEASLNGMLDIIAGQFNLSAETIYSVAASCVAESAKSEPEKLWDVCRSVARPRLQGLAERIVTGSSRTARWDDLVLPELQKQTLRQMALQSRHRMKVHETWGFAARGRRGLGLSALFAGPSGTGKTLAAEVLAGELKLDLYRIDLSAVVSKYIGETEKNLKQVFDAADEGGVMLLFDEADALFGKRAEVKDSHDRYANIEVGYLLQRMENFLGVAILATNFKSSLDKAFQRRLRFTVDFPFPDADQREAIWRLVFPKATPTEGLDYRLLAQLNMTGGNIRNIALNAAFLAAAGGSPVRLEHLLQATRQEAIKIERPLSDIEIRGWV
jgi:ATPase family protein associated with various cellular activities (AAA)/winged helix domain-containing protein